MSAQQVAWAVLILAAIGATVCLICLPLAWFVDWSLGRQAARTAADTFADDFIAENIDVIEQDTPVIVEEIVSLLEDSRQHIERLRSAGR